jgi:hypothetical protein
MEPNVVVVVLGVIALLLALGKRPTAEPEPVPVRVSDEPPTRQSDR